MTGRSRIWPGTPYPLGASWDGRGVNFALFSENGEKVELCLYDPRGLRQIDSFFLPERTDDVFHGYVPEARPGMLYGYRVYGPYEPRNGHRFNHHKLLLDPYAKQVAGKLRWTDANYGYRLGSAREDLSFDRRDNARSMVKGVVVDSTFTWGNDRHPARDWARTIIYEAHLRGLTAHCDQIDGAIRGTAAGLNGHVIDHLKRLGVTVIEFLPVHYAVNNRWLVAKGLTNYWGYNSLGYFAVNPHFLSENNLYEFKSMVARLHAADIEVVLDVVYNHTGEGNRLGPTLSFRGIDNKSYYRLGADPQYYDDVTGTGNTLNFTHPRVVQLVMDSLRYWVEEMHVDGFRFDLATALGRTGTGFDWRAGLFDAIRQDPVLAGTKLIAEPWDLGLGGYQLGNMGQPFAEWNDRYRNTVRQFWRGDKGRLPELASRLAGSADIFEYSRRKPWASINHVTCHDGFTLADLVSYEHKHNEANGEQNHDGTDENFSANYGSEGPSSDPAIVELRRRQRRNLLATLLLSQGTPMLLAGDEFGHSQHGNNNAWCQDNEISWINWRIDAEDDQTDFIARLIRLREEHPALPWPRFLHGQVRDEDGLPDIGWFRPDGQEMTSTDWEDPEARTLGMLVNGRVGVGLDAGGRHLSDVPLLVLLHAGFGPIDFYLPRVAHALGWCELLDTARYTSSNVCDFGTAYHMESRSVALMLLQEA